MLKEHYNTLLEELGQKTFELPASACAKWPQSSYISVAVATFGLFDYHVYYHRGHFYEIKYCKTNVLVKRRSTNLIMTSEVCKYTYYSEFTKLTFAKKVIETFGYINLHSDPDFDYLTVLGGGKHGLFAKVLDKKGKVLLTVDEVLS